MKKFSVFLLLIAILFCTLNKTLAYYNTNSTLTNSFITKKYNLEINGNGGTFSDSNVTVKNNSVTLPTPQRLGYDFLGYVDSNNISYTTSISNVDNINNKSLAANWNAITYSISYDLNGGTAITVNSYTANWTKNYYTVNYYVNNSLWTQRAVGYNDALENLNAQSSLDIYHTFHDGMVG